VVFLLAKTWMKYVWGRLGIAVFIIVALAIWIAAIWFLVCAPGTRRPALIIKFPDSTPHLGASDGN
jgi:hypothetical protein